MELYGNNRITWALDPRSKNMGTLEDNKIQLYVAIGSALIAAIANITAAVIS